MTRYSVYPLMTAKVDRATSFYTYLRVTDDISTVFYGAFLLKGPRRHILVDTGCDAASYAAGPLSSVQDVASLAENLACFGLTIRDIDAVILTHLHFDHTAFLHLFSHCPKYVQEKEWLAARNPHPYFADFYVPAYYQDANFELIDGDRVLFPGLEVVLVPGHSAGSQAVIVDTDTGRTAVSGFCCLAENFTGDKFAIPGIHKNVQQAYDSMVKLMGLADLVYANYFQKPVKL